MSTEREQTEAVGVSRRQLLARSAVVAGVAWAAPVIRTTKAYATASAGTERPCTHFYVVCVSRTDAWPMFPDREARLPRAWRPSARGRGPNSTPSQTAGGNPGATTDFSAGGVDASPGPGVTVAPSSTATTGTTGTTGTTVAGGTTPSPPGPSTAAAPPDPGTSRSDPLGLTRPSVTPDPTDPDAETPDDTAFAKTIGADLPDPQPLTILEWVYQNPGIPLEFPEVRPVVSQTSPTAWACLLPPVNGPDWQVRQCKLVRGVYKNGADFGGPAYLDPNPLLANETGRRVVCPVQGGGKGGYGGRDGHDGYQGHGPGGRPKPAIGVPAAGAPGTGPTSSTSTSTTSTSTTSTSSSTTSSSTTSSSTTSSSTTSSSTTSSTSPSSSTTSTSTTVPPGAASNLPRDTRTAHYDRHECLILVFCCP